MSRIFILKAGFLLLLGLGTHSRLYCQYIIEWAKTHGTIFEANEPRIARQTNDGGYIVAGGAQFLDDVLNEITGPTDCWVMKLDKLGNIEWSRNYGGTDYDYATDIIEVENGSFIVNARAQSNDGDVDENHGGYDCWIFKLSKDGDIIWQKSLGSSEDDICRGLLLDDGNVLTTLNTYLTPGNIAFNLWSLVKMDSDGNEIWVKNYDNIDSTETAGKPLRGIDGNYYIMGSDLREGTFIWTRNIDKNGVSIWETKTYKPSDHTISDIRINSEGNAVCVGTTSSENPDSTPYDGDIRILGIPLKNQGSLPDGIYGGSGIEYSIAIQHLQGGRYLIGGVSSSIDGDVGANYTEGPVQLFDWWLFIIDEKGKILWDKNFGGSNSELLFSMEPTSDGGFILAGTSDSNDHDLSEIDNRRRAWIVKLAPVNTTGTCDPPKLYPNPAIGETVTIEVTQGFGEGSKVEMFDVTGRLIFELPSDMLAKNISVEIPAELLPRAGMYFIRTNCGEQTHVLKFVRL